MCVGVFEDSGEKVRKVCVQNTAAWCDFGLFFMKYITRENSLNYVGLEERTVYAKEYVLYLMSEPG